VNYQPTPPPRTSASYRTWYRDGAPIPFADDLYYPTGPIVYFDPNTMVPTGSYDGVTLYADTTLEPYSVVFVPIGSQMLRPYKRLGTGDLAGTAGNRPPSLPTQVGHYRVSPPRGVPEDQQQRAQRPTPKREPAGQPEPAERFEEPASGLLVETVRKPIDNLGIWVSFQGYRWEHAGDAIPLDRAKLDSVGEYHGSPVYADPRTPYVIYIPSRANLVAPFRRAQTQ
jgi:hypothetical protein